VGDVAPATNAVRADGRPWSIDEHRGRNLLLIFHRHIH
jgi:peroxiredoxin